MDKKLGTELVSKNVLSLINNNKCTFCLSLPDLCCISNRCTTINLESRTILSPTPAGPGNAVNQQIIERNVVISSWTFLTTWFVIGRFLILLFTTHMWASGGQPKFQMCEIKLLSDVSLSLIIDVSIDAKITNIFVKDSYIRLFL